MKNLENCCVKVEAHWSSSNAIEIGTGFFINPNGLVLTCFHVVCQKDRDLADKVIVKYGNREFSARYVYISINGGLLDFALLELVGFSLPNNDNYLELADWAGLSYGDRNYITYGFKSENLDGVFGKGDILGEVRISSTTSPVLQFTDPSSAQAGMSGAPLFHEETQRVVGVILGRVEEGSTYPIATPIGEIGRACLQVKRILDDQLLFDKLTAFFRDNFTDESDLSDFYDLLPVLNLPAFSSLQRERASHILRILRQREQLKYLPIFLETCYPNLPKPDGLPDSPTVTFVNRDYEIEQAFHPEAATCLLYSAPAGYGKSQLIEVIEQRTFSERRLVVPIRIPRPITCPQLFAEIINRFSYHTAILTNPDDILTLTQRMVGDVHRCCQSQKIIGVTLLIDNAEFLAGDDIRQFVDHFLLPLQKGLKFSGKILHIRLSGRYVMEWDRLLEEQNWRPKVISMSPFRFKYVKETVRRYYDKMQREDQAKDAVLDLYAAYLMQTTAGHPGCMAEVIRLLGVIENDVELAFDINEEQIQQIVERTIDEIRQSIPRHLQGHFNALSVYRCYDLDLLERMQERDILPKEPNAIQLEEELIPTNLIERGRRGQDETFLKDDVVRRLLILSLVQQNKTKFLEMSQQAREIYLNVINDQGASTHVIILEALYQELSFRYYNSAQDLPARMVLSGEFFKPDGILDQYLSKLKGNKSRSKWINARNALVSRLADTENSSACEFQFAVNFFLRQDDFDDQPYLEMIRRIKACG